MDSGLAAALAVKRRLEASGLTAGEGEGQLACYSTDNPERFAAVAGRFLGREVMNVQWVGTDELISETVGER